MSYTFLLEQGEESSAECFSGIPACVLSRLSLTVGKCFWPASGTESCGDSLSGTMLKLSQGANGEGLSISSAGDSPARTLVLPARELGLRVSGAGCGVSLPGSLARWDRDTFSWRTSQLCLFEEGCECLATLPRWGMTVVGELYPLPTPELRTCASGSGFWPTPDAGVFNISESVESFLARAERMGEKHNHAPFRPPLGVAVKMWPTPQARDWRSGKTGAATAEKNCRPLSEVVVWSTPTSADGMGGPGNSGRAGGENLRTQVGGSLSPIFVEWLMGFPIGWTGLEPLATDRFLKWPRSPGNY